MPRLMSLVLAVAVVTVVGCSGSDVSKDGTAAAVSSDAASRDASPEGAVTKFLEAVRTGNSEVASACLTPLALEEIKKNELEFAPPSSETAQYRVGKVEVFEADKVFVESVWIEKDADGTPFEETMTWGLKRIDGLWRISGMAAHVGPDQPPIVIDFENPDQFIGLQEPAPAAAGEGTPRQASQPAQDPFNPTISR